ncbi:MAG: metal ABC transporter permease [Planctomycetes bacterium]|nr:metal ABC transporter permease [Planctomycetota bacterium]
MAGSPLLLHALVCGLLASVAAGVIGPYVVVRRITYIAGGIAHCVLAGLGAAYYFQIEYGWTWCDPILGASVAAILAALLIGWVSLRARQREDTLIGALWAIGTAVGVLFIQSTRGYAPDLMSLLFGNIMLVSARDMWLVAGLDALVVAIGLLFYNQFVAVCFDEEFARLRGLRVEFWYLLLLCLVALTVVVLMKVVGIVLVIALLTLPVAVGAIFARSLWQSMIAASLLSMVFVTLGLGTAYQANWPAGATIIIVAGAAYLLVAMFQIFTARRRA